MGLTLKTGIKNCVRCFVRAPAAPLSGPNSKSRGPERENKVQQNPNSGIQHCSHPLLPPPGPSPIGGEKAPTTVHPVAGEELNGKEAAVAPTYAGRGEADGGENEVLLQWGLWISGRASRPLGSHSVGEEVGAATRRPRQRRQEGRCLSPSVAGAARSTRSSVRSNRSGQWTLTQSHLTTARSPTCEHARRREGLRRRHHLPSWMPWAALTSCSVRGYGRGGGKRKKRVERETAAGRRP